MSDGFARDSPDVDLNRRKKAQAAQNEMEGIELVKQLIQKRIDPRDLMRFSILSFLCLLVAALLAVAAATSPAKVPSYIAVASSTWQCLYQTLSPRTG